MAARTQDQNLDSLLDTMANVVGILVVLVAVTQLSVGEAVDRISQRQDGRAEVSAEDVAVARARVAEVETAITAAEGELEAYAASERRRGILLEEIRPHVEALEALEGRFPLPDGRQAELAETVRAQRAAVANLAVEVDDAERKLSRLEALITDVPAELRPKIARLPDPRPPPASAKERAFVCRYGRVAALDLEGLEAMLRRGIRGALGDDRSIGFGDREWLVNLFAKRSFGSGNFYWAIREDQERSFWADIRWVDETYGETLADLRRDGSAFAQVLDATSRSDHYARFYVWNDSFEVYLEARYLAESKGWDVSWLAVPEDVEVGIDLLGGNRRKVLLD